MRHLKTDRHYGFQARPRMRVPREMLPSTYQLHLIQAIRCNSEIDEGGLYLRALRDITGGENSAVFADVSKLVDRVVSGKLRGNRRDEAVKTLIGSHRLNRDEDAYLNILEFNRKFLNDRALFALLTLLVLDATKLDLVRMDTFRGREALGPAYGPRRTQGDKRLGSDLQERLKQFAILDEEATMEAAGRYIDYRFLDHASLPEYKRRQELRGNPRSDRYLRDWFGKFDKALGYPPPGPGRPPNKR